MRAALDKILSGHEPYPAIVVDHRWDLVAANEAALALLTDGVDPSLLGERGNALRISLHPDGLAPASPTWPSGAATCSTGCGGRRRCRPTPPSTSSSPSSNLPGRGRRPPRRADGPAPLFVPLQLRAGDVTLSFVSTVATFGTARDITAAELSIESFFPADDATASFLLGVRAPERSSASARSRRVGPAPPPGRRTGPGLARGTPDGDLGGHRRHREGEAHADGEVVAMDGARPPGCA